MTTAYINSPAGIAGDMLLGAFLDAGAPLDHVVAAVRKVQPGGWSLRAERVERAWAPATHAVVEVDGAIGPRRGRDLIDLVAEADLPAATRTFEALVAVEAKVHGVPFDEVHLHEAGGTDAVVDVVGSAAAARALGITDVYASPPATGTVTAPAVAALFEGRPLRLTSLPGETVTPTGAALLRGFDARFEDITLVPRTQGLGAGTRDPQEFPNVVQVVVGDRQLPAATMVVVEANVDDATPEVLAHAVERLVASGAADAWMTPIVMKKGRLGVTVSALAEPQYAATVERLVLRLTGTFGVRRHTVSRTALERDWVSVEVGGQRVRVKRAHLDGEVTTFAAEWEDARAAASKLNRPVAEVMAQAVAKAREGATSPSGS